MSHTWIRNPATDAYWQCPDGILDDLLAGEWERCDPPVEHNPVTAEHAAWRETQAAEAAAQEKAAAKTKSTTKAAARGESQEG